MNPPQNINNHFNTPLKAQDIQVSPMCCCYYNFTERGFYKFINIWDLVFCILTLLNFNLIKLILNVLFLIIVIIALVSFCNTNQYNTGIHKTYAIIRLIFVFLQLIYLIAFSVLFILAFTSGQLNDHEKTIVIVNLVINLAIVLPIVAVSIQWSFLLKRVVNYVDSAPQVQQNNNYPQPGVNSGFNPDYAN